MCRGFRAKIRRQELNFSIFGYFNRGNGCKITKLWKNVDLFNSFIRREDIRDSYGITMSNYNTKLYP